MVTCNHFQASDSDSGNDDRCASYRSKSVGLIDKLLKVEFRELAGSQ